MPEPVRSGQPNAACPRCGVPFHCGVADATPCACTTLALDDALRAALRARYVGCLCVRCLRDIAAQQSAPARVAQR